MASKVRLVWRVVGLVLCFVSLGRCEESPGVLENVRGDEDIPYDPVEKSGSRTTEGTSSDQQIPILGSQKFEPAAPAAKDDDISIFPPAGDKPEEEEEGGGAQRSSVLSSLDARNGQTPADNVTDSTPTGHGEVGSETENRQGGRSYEVNNTPLRGNTDGVDIQGEAGPSPESDLDTITAMRGQEGVKPPYDTQHDDGGFQAQNTHTGDFLAENVHTSDDDNGYQVKNSDQDGYQAKNRDHDDEDEFPVHKGDHHGFQSQNSDNDGFQSQNSDNDGFQSQNSDDDGFQAQNSDDNGFQAQNSDDDGFQAQNSDDNGFQAQNTHRVENDGFRVQNNHTRYDNEFPAQKAQSSDANPLGTAAGSYSETAAGSYSETAAGSYSETAAGSYSETAAGSYSETSAGSHSETAAGSHSETAAGSYSETRVNGQTDSEQQSDPQPSDSRFHNPGNAHSPLNSGDTENDTGELGTSDTWPLFSEDENRNPVGRVSDSDSNNNNLLSKSPEQAGQPAESASQFGHFDNLDVEENEGSDDLQDDAGPEDTPVTSAFEGDDDESFEDKTDNFREGEMETGLNDDNKVFSTDGLVLEIPEQPLTNTTDSEDDEGWDVLDDDFYDDTDDEEYEDEEEEKEEEDEEEEEDDWWYYDTDRKAGHKEWSSSSTPLPDDERKANDEQEAKEWPSTSTPPPRPDDEPKANDEQEGKVPPTIHEGVIEIEEVMKKKNDKKVNGPKDSVILYTALVVVLIAGIVIFSFWKNTSKRSRARNQASTVEPGEEGKRLLDHPFV